MELQYSFLSRPVRTNGCPLSRHSVTNSCCSVSVFLRNSVVVRVRTLNGDAGSVAIDVADVVVIVVKNEIQLRLAHKNKRQRAL